MFKKILSWFTKKEILVVKQEETKQQEYTPDISEPILSFVEVFLKNPKRFRLKEYGLETYKLTDKQTKEEFKFLIDHYSMFSYYRGPFIITPTSSNIRDIGLTFDEHKYLAKHIGNYYSERKQRILNKRNSNSKQRSRNHLTKIYKGE